MGVAAPTQTASHPHDRLPPPPLETVRTAFPQLEIIEMIGQGGMGAVFKARQPKLNRLVALKLLPEGLSQDAAFADRFTREAQMLARLHHPNIVTIHDFGQANGFFYLLMEYVDGVNLRQAMAAGRFTPEQALAIVPMICDALQYAHDEGVLHRDVKPENILLDQKGRVRLVDFGIAKLAHAAPAPEEGSTGLAPSPSQLTQTGASLGTPSYMAPEQQLSPATVDQRADIYSLGVVFYELLTGELPTGRLTPPSRKTPVDPRVDDVVLRAMAHQKEQRYRTAQAVKTAVEALGPKPFQEMPPAATGFPVPLPAWAKYGLLAGFAALDGLMAYELINSGLVWALWGRITAGWREGLTTLAGLVVVAGVALYVWRRRRWLMAPFEVQPAPRVPAPGWNGGTSFGDHWVRAACLFISLLGLQCVWMLLSGVLLLTQSAISGAGLLTLSLLVPLGVFITPPGLAVVLLAAFLRRELKRESTVVAAPTPSWWLRAAIGFLAFAVIISVPMPRGDAPTAVMGFGGFVAVGALALVTRSRIWRAIALAFMTELLVVGLFGLVFFFIMNQQGNLTAEWTARVGPFEAVELAVGMQVLSLLCYAAGLAAFLLPSAKAAFGIPPSPAQSPVVAPAR